jgi:hypothetical protein
VAAHHRDGRAAARRERVFRQLGNWTFRSRTGRLFPIARLGSNQRKAFWATSLRALTGAWGKGPGSMVVGASTPSGGVVTRGAGSGSPGSAPFE